MHNQQITTAIVLKRTNYGEADRIVTLLTPEGKVTLMARGVRKIKSKLAGGIELFSVADITYVRGRGDVGTLVSARLRTHYNNIAKNIDRTMVGYDLLKILDTCTEDETEADYFVLLGHAFAALDDPAVLLELVQLWFSAQLLALAGHTPNLTRDTTGNTLSASGQYEFSFDDHAFFAREGAPYGADAIKFLRLLFSGATPVALTKIVGASELTQRVKPIITFLQQQYLRVK